MRHFGLLRAAALAAFFLWGVLGRAEQNRAEHGCANCDAQISHEIYARAVFWIASRSCFWNAGTTVHGSYGVPCGERVSIGRKPRNPDLRTIVTSFTRSV